MKKTTLGILIFLLFAITAYSLRNFDKYKVLKVIDSAHIYADLNKNNQIDEEELVKISGINTFTETPPQKLNIGKKYSFFLDYFGKIYAENNLNTKQIKLKQVKNSEYQIFVGKKDFSKLILSEGQATADNDEYKKYNNAAKIKQLTNEADKKQYVIYNLNNKKYHKLDCKFGIETYNYKLYPIKELPKDASKCNYCFEKNKFKQNTSINTTQIAPYKTFKNITVYFLDFKNLKPQSSCSSLACKSLLNEINQAKQAIDFAIYGINKEPDIIEALLKANKRGVTIRWVADADQNPEDYYPDTKTLMHKLKNYNSDSPSFITYSNKKDKRAIMHNKFFIFDNQKVWTGSANITNTDLSEFNANYALLISSSQLAKLYKNEFEQLYSGKFHNLKQSNPAQPVTINTTTKITALYSPQDKIIKSTVIPLIDKAQNYIYIPIFFLTHKDLATHLITAESRGVDIKIITDSTNAHGKYTIHKDLRTAGIKVKTENKAGKMHMKTIIIDDKYSIIGSMNLTKSGEQNNDENMLLIESSGITKYLKLTFLYLWNEIPDKYLNIDPRAESYESIGSCKDGIDNDFDGLIDEKDDSCKFTPIRK